MQSSASCAAASMLRAARAARAISSSRARSAVSSASDAQSVSGVRSRSGQHAAGADAHHGFGILGLMIVGRGGQRHEQGAQARGLQLGDGHGARAAQGEIRPRIGGRHVLDERQHLGLDLERVVGGARRLESALAGLMAHLRTARADRGATAPGARRRSGAARPGCRRTPAAALRRFAAREAHCGSGDGGDVGAHRIADGARLHARGKAAGKCFQHLVGDACEPAVGQGRRRRSVRGSAAECAAATRRSRPARSRSRPAPSTARGAHAAQHARGLQHGGDDAQRRRAATRQGPCRECP